MNLEQLKQLAEESWEGCDGCTEQDKYFWTKGYQAGYNRATPKEISDIEIKEMANKSKSIFKEDMYRVYFIMGAKWYREQLNQTK